MRISRNFLITVILAVGLTAGLENLFILIFNDSTPCFFHNSLGGNLLLWLLRTPIFIAFATFIQQLLAPKFVSLKERMIERDELEAKEKAKEEKSLRNGKFAFEL
jgi:hypothetical protein